MTCWKCNPPPMRRADLCVQHLASERKKNHDARIQRAMAGLCTCCRDDAEPGRSYCDKHLKSYAAAQRRYERRKRNDAHAS